MTEGRVLVLDDDPAVGETVKFISEDIGFEARALTSPVEFFELLDAWTPTHIVLDLVMPQMDGVEVIRYLAQRNCRASIIISSGVGGRVLDAAHRAAREQGLPILGVLSKPFSPSALKSYLLSGAGAPAETVKEAPEKAQVEPVEIDENAILLGIQNHEFKVVYQPIVVCATETLAGFEALARWEHPKGTIMPDRFIPVSESLGLIDQITRQVAQAAMSWMASRYGSRKWSLSINISPAGLTSKRLADRLEAMCLEARLSPMKLIVELTETATMDDAVVALELLTRLRMKGFHLSIDDFGTGYSSLSQLARMPFSELKVDKAFITTAAESPESRTIIRSIVDLGHNLGLRVVAEGVEDAKTLEFLRHVGCDYAQGYHIARPMAADKLEAWVLENFKIQADDGGGQLLVQ